MNTLGAIQIIRGLIQLGITAEQYKAAVNNPEMSDEDLAKHLSSNQDKLEELKARDH
jgi:hypothetical protein